MKKKDKELEKLKEAFGVEKPGEKKEEIKWKLSLCCNSFVCSTNLAVKFCSSCLHILDENFMKTDFDISQQEQYLTSKLQSYQQLLPKVESEENDIPF